MRYSSIQCQVWHDEKYLKLSDPAKLLFFYFQTSPHSNILGCFVVGKGYICEDLTWTRKKLSKVLPELEKSGFIMYDNSTNLVLIIDYLRHNPLANPNQTKAAFKSLDALPVSPLFRELRRLIPAAHNKDWIGPLIQILDKKILSLPETVPQRVPVMVR